MEFFKGLLVAIIMVTVLALIIAYPIWQYRVCRQNVCEGKGCFWYCLQHAG